MATYDLRFVRSAWDNDVEEEVLMVSSVYKIFKIEDSVSTGLGTCLLHRQRVGCLGLGAATGNAVPIYKLPLHR